MPIQRKKRSLVVAVAATGAVLSVGATAVFAGTLYPVAVNSSTAAGTHVITASTSTGAEFAGLTCTSSALTGTNNYVTSGTSVDPAARLGGVTFTGCPGRTITQVGTWSFEADSGATPATNVVVGRVTNISARVSSAPVPTVCSYTVQGEADATYNEATGVLDVHEPATTGNLYATSVVGCGGLPATGDPVSYNAAYRIATVAVAVTVGFSSGLINIG